MERYHSYNEALELKITLHYSYRTDVVSTKPPPVKTDDQAKEDSCV